jgi:hypothetical protein
MHIRNKKLITLSEQLLDKILKEHIFKMYNENIIDFYSEDAQGNDYQTNTTKNFSF